MNPNPSPFDGIVASLQSDVHAPLWTLIVIIFLVVAIYGLGNKRQ